jgi:hypothetical protein
MSDSPFEVKAEMEPDCPGKVIVLQVLTENNKKVAGGQFGRTFHSLSGKNHEEEKAVL